MLFYEHNEHKINRKADNDMQKKIVSVYKDVDNISMLNASNDCRFKQNDEYVEIGSTINENTIVDITVLGDGSW